MRALCWYGHGDIRYENAPDPTIQDPRDAIIKVTSCAICGSDLHLLGGFVPTMKRGDVLGHETMGEVVEVGTQVKKLKVGDRVVVPFTISCGECRMCQWGYYSCCERTNPAGKEEAKVVGYPTAGLFGYSHMNGGFPGGQAEYLRVPHADIGPIVVPEGLRDEQVLFLSDIFPTAYVGAEDCNIKKGQTIAVFGCGPVGQLAVKCCFLLGAERVIAIDTIPERLSLARRSGAETIDYASDHLQDTILELTNGKGPDSVIEAVGLESHGTGGLIEGVKTSLTEIERPYALKQAIIACRPGGTVALRGVFMAEVSVPMGPAISKGLTLKMGQTHVQKYLKPLLQLVADDKIDPSFIITDRIALKDGPAAYKRFRDKTEGCIKVVMRP